MIENWKAIIACRNEQTTKINTILGGNQRTKWILNDRNGISITQSVSSRTTWAGQNAIQILTHLAPVTAILDDVWSALIKLFNFSDYWLIDKNDNNLTYF